jgi:hypothetical protein
MSFLLSVHNLLNELKALHSFGTGPISRTREGLVAGKGKTLGSPDSGGLKILRRLLRGRLRCGR